MIRLILGIVSAGGCLIFVMPVIAMGLPLVVAVGLVCALSKRLEPKAIRWQEIYEFHSGLGWKAKPNLEGYVVEERDDVFQVVTDQDGWPGKTPLAQSHVVVFGDSHAWGYGVDHRNSFSQLNRDLQVKAVGAPGYNLVQELLLMESLALQLKDKLVIWFVYIGNDLFDNLSPEMSGYRCPFVHERAGCEDWEVVTRHLSPSRWRASNSATLRRFYAVLPALHSDTFLAKRAYEACEYIVGRGATVCRDAGAKLVVVSIPSPATLDEKEMDRLREARGFTLPVDRDLPDKKLSAICLRHGVDFVPLKQYLNTTHFKERDDHWTESGHHRVAAVIRDLYSQHSQNGNCS